MAEIKCPKCGTVISLEQSEIDSVVKQVRDEEFARELAERMSLVQAEKDQALKVAQTEKDQALKLAEAEKEQALKLAQAEADAALQLARTQTKADLQGALAERDRQIAELRMQLEAQDESHKAQQELAVTRAVASVEKERDSLKAAVELAQAEKARSEATLKEQLVEQAKAKDEVIAFQQGEIERMKDMKARLSTKMVGESLEQHCLYEFNKIRATAFPNAYFDKDNDATDGTKGDFIFRECDEDGNEIISIMFEMKNLEDTASRKKRNEDHFAKLDKDRTKKGCEYAILVSLLEPDNELYNEGIVDVSWCYPKMFVVRPQFFIPIISLLRNAAASSMEYKRELALVRQQDLDITNFERDLDLFKQGFFRNFELAGERFDDAIEGIDKTIKLLEKIKENLTKSEKHLSAANNKLEDLTVKKLVSKNPTMKAKFEELENEN